MAFEPHFKRNLLLVFVNDGHGEAETDNNEIYGRACCGKRRDPPALTTALISDPGAPPTGNSLRFPHRSDGVISERHVILRICALRASGYAFVIDDRTYVLYQYL